MQISAAPKMASLQLLHACCLYKTRINPFLVSKGRHLQMQEPGEWYEYRLRDSSDTLSFRASPMAGPDSQVSFVVYGDMGESDHARAKAPGCVPVSSFCRMASYTPLFVRSPEEGCGLHDMHARCLLHMPSACFWVC